MSVTLNDDDFDSISKPKLFFDLKEDYFGPLDVSNDGTKVLVQKDISQRASQQKYIVIMNFIEKVKALDPARKKD